MTTRALVGRPVRVNAAPRRAITAPGAAPRERDRYIDSLRAFALIRVVVYHFYGFIWLPIVFPSMGIMFAIGASLMAASLERETRHYSWVLRRRLRRLLVPFWAFGLVVVPVMFVLGWSDSSVLGQDVNAGVDVPALLLWVLPVSPPPGSVMQADWVLPLWYISTYLWLMLLSPGLLWLFRRWPKRTLAVPAAIVLLWSVELLSLEGPGGTMVLLLSTYAACWMLGFAHHDGMIRRMPLWQVLSVGVATAALGLWYAFTYPDPQAGPNVSDVPVATLLYGFGVTLLLLRVRLDFSWLKRVAVLDHLVSAINRRAVTIYLWSNAAIGLAWAMADWEPLAGLLYESPLPSHVPVLAASFVLIGVFAVVVGWVEDLASGRPPRLVPSFPRGSRPVR